MSYLEYPKQLLKTTVEGQISEINSYLIRLVDTINHNFDSEGVDKILERAVSYNSSVGNSYSGLAGLTPDAKDKYYTTFANLKNLIISNATEVYQSETEPIINKFEKTYKAISNEFGQLETYLNTEITQDVEGLSITSSRIEGILGKTNDIESMVDFFQGYIYAGWLDKPTESKWGIEVGKIADTFEVQKSDGTKVPLSNTNKYFVRIEPTEIGFYFNNDKLCYISQDKLYFPNADIEASSGNIGGWCIAGDSSASNGFWSYSLSNIVDTGSKKYAVFLRGGTDTKGAYQSTNKVIGVRAMDSSYPSVSSNWSDGTKASYNFYVQADGKLYANNAVIKGDITATSLTLDGATLSYNSLSDKPTIPDVSIYIAKDGTVGSTPSKDATGFKVSSKGLLQAANATIWGTIYASAGEIGGWSINNSYIGYKSSSASWADNNTFLLHPTGTSSEYTVAGQSVSNLNIICGSNFGVTTSGKLYAKGAEVAGKITATSGTIGGWTVGSSYLGKKADSDSWGDNNTVLLHPTGTSSEYTVAGVKKSGWTIISGSGFGVDKNGICNTNGMLAVEMAVGHNLYLSDNLCLKCTGTGGSYSSNMTNYPIVLQWLNSAINLGADNKKLKIIGNPINLCNYVNVEYGFNFEYGGTYKGAIQMYNNEFCVGIENAPMRFYGSSIYLLGEKVLKSSNHYTYSDRNLKHDIKDIDSNMTNFFNSLHPVQYVLNDDTNNLNHTGFIAQEVKQAAIDNNIDVKHLACHGEFDNSSGLIYEEFIALNTFMIQKLSKRIEELENKINS